MSWAREDGATPAPAHLHLAPAPPEGPADERPGIDLARVEADRRRDAEAALAGLYRRVLDLEAGSISREASVRELQRRLAEAEVEVAAMRATVAELEPQAAELVLLRRTKTFRWTASPRRAYGAVLRRSRR